MLLLPCYRDFSFHFFTASPHFICYSLRFCVVCSSLLMKAALLFRVLIGILLHTAFSSPSSRAGSEEAFPAAMQIIRDDILRRPRMRAAFHFRLCFRLHGRRVSAESRLPAVRRHACSRLPRASDILPLLSLSRIVTPRTPRYTFLPLRSVAMPRVSRRSAGGERARKRQAPPLRRHIFSRHMPPCRFFNKVRLDGCCQKARGHVTFSRQPRIDTARWRHD